MSNKLQVGQQLWYVTSEYRRKNDRYVTVTSVGRKYAYLSNYKRIYIETLDGEPQNGYAAHGKCYLSKSEHDKELFHVEVHSAFRDMVRGLARHETTTEAIQAATAALGAQTPWVPASTPPGEDVGEVLVEMPDGTHEIAWATYQHGASNEFAQWSFRDPDEDREPVAWLYIPKRKVEA